MRRPHHRLGWRRSAPCDDHLHEMPFMALNA
jgi:hypothetical protein